jgi:hypothetical protein
MFVTYPNHDLTFGTRLDLSQSAKLHHFQFYITLVVQTDGVF